MDGQEHLSNESWYRQNKTISKYSLPSHFLEIFLERAKDAYLIKSHAFIHYYVINLDCFCGGKETKQYQKCFWWVFWCMISDMWFLSSWDFFPLLWDLLVHKPFCLGRERWIWRNKVWKLEKSDSIVVNLTELQVTLLERTAGAL